MQMGGEANPKVRNFNTGLTVYLTAEYLLRNDIYERNEAIGLLDFMQGI